MSAAAFLRAGLACLLTAVCALPAFAQPTPLGVWQSIDDETAAPKALLRITQRPDGTLSGRIEKLLIAPPVPDPVCIQCSDDRKDQPIVGLEIIRGAKQASGRLVWEGGRILDPENGTTYALRLTPTDNGEKLQVRGSFGPFSRTQTWVRVAR